MEDYDSDDDTMVWLGGRFGVKACVHDYPGSVHDNFMLGYGGDLDVRALVGHL